MKTTEIMKIEYSEPVVRVKEVSRRRCVAQSNDGTGSEGFSTEYGTVSYDESLDNQ